MPNTLSDLKHATADWKTYIDAIKAPPPEPEALVELKKLLKDEGTGG